MGETVSYRSNGGTREGYLALPADGGTRPAVVVIQESWTLGAHITSIADRFAEAGFVALAPDLCPGGPSAVAGGTPAESVDALLSGLDQAAKEVAGAAEYLAGRAEVTGKIGCVGFAAGGGLALWSAPLSERIVAAAAFYPVLPWERMGTGWADYAGKAALVHRPEQDGAATAEGVAAARRAIEAAGGECAVYDYPGTAPSFFNDDRPDVFDREAAASAWARTLELFRAKLG
ncbi:dienelactone hydrolase family protein [Micromonospora sp. NPDC049559]|uniref:dienelactone hydrolase family protein n=1 Tax=Micromonospora sp. NPDC049559 TaxID=3155923 RepID=UPI003426C566